MVSRSQCLWYVMDVKIWPESMNPIVDLLKYTENLGILNECNEIFGKCYVFYLDVLKYVENFMDFARM